MKGFLPDALFSGIPQAWSLTVEFCFYLLAPIIFFLLRNRAALYLLAGLILFTMVFTLNGFSDILPSQNPFMLTYTFPGRCLEFFSGCIVSILYSNGYRKSFSYPVFTLSGIVGIALVPAVLSIASFSSPHWFGILVLHLLLPFLIAVFFRGLLSENSFIKSFFSLKIMQILGRSSFAFYLIHVGVVERGLSLFVSHNVLLLFLLLNLLAWILYQFVETPARRWVLRRFAI
jgi:peptidoglycan/LPS O-acetylase OafA/YrhL